MTPEEYRLAKVVFLEARELPRKSWNAYLNDSIAPLSLHPFILELLEDEDLSSEDSAPKNMSDVGHLASFVPSTLGDYKILGVLGFGGMGLVYEAEQNTPKRKVALKVIRPGWINDELLRRFQREIEIVGRLRHPGIAQIYEAGRATTEYGELPFFSMELIDGDRLPDYVSKQRLGVEERAKLLCRVVRIIDYAHAEGVIHRDLKPDNILIDRDGNPKVLDFGISRSIGEDWKTSSLHTESGQLLGTLPYMSPEQLEDDGQVGRTTDVYALGVLAYQLFSGRLPCDVSALSLPQAIRKLTEQRGRSLKESLPQCHPDLSAVVDQAIAREEARRYQSATDFADDIDRYLARLPVMARPPSAYYQVKSFARRNRLVAGSVVVAIGAIVVGASASIFWALDAIKERDHALELRALADERLIDLRAESLKLNSVVEFLRQMLGGIDTVALGVQGETVSGLRVMDVLDDAAIQLDGFPPNDRDVERALRTTLGESYAQLHRFDASTVQFARALEILDGGAPDSVNESLRISLALGTGYAYGGDPKRAESLLVELRKKAEEHLGGSHEILFEISNQIAAAILLQGRVDDALAHSKTVREDCSKVLGPTHIQSLVARHNHAFVLRSGFRFDEAISEFTKVIEDKIERYGSENIEVARTRKELATTFVAAGDPKRAEVQSRLALKSERAVFGDAHPVTISTMHQLACCLILEGHSDEARELLDVGMSHLSLRGQTDTAAMYSMKHQRARLAIQDRDPNKAVSIDREVFDWRCKNLGDDHPLTLASQVCLAEDLEMLEDFEEAEEYYEDAIELAQEVFGVPNQRVCMYRLEHGRCLRKLGLFEESEEVLLSSLEDAEVLFGEDAKGLTPIIDEIVGLYRAMGSINEERAWQKRLEKLGTVK